MIWAGLRSRAADGRPQAGRPRTAAHKGDAMLDHMLLLYDRSTIGNGGGDGFGVFYDKLYKDSDTYRQCLMPIKSLAEVRDKVSAYLGQKGRQIDVLVIHGHGNAGLIGAGGGWRAGPADPLNTITSKTLDGVQRGQLTGIATEMVAKLPQGHYPPIILFTSCDSGLKKNGGPDYDFAAEVSEAFDGCVVLLALGHTTVIEKKHAFGVMYKIAKCSEQGVAGGSVTKGYFVVGYRGASGWKDVEDYIGQPFPYSELSFEQVITL
jgi:hypothetical protein